jgi:hypothetical protein
MVEDVRRFEETARKKDSMWAMSKGLRGGRTAKDEEHNGLSNLT